jgi:hypothetical protein
MTAIRHNIFVANIQYEISFSPLLPVTYTNVAAIRSYIIIKICIITNSSSSNNNNNNNNNNKGTNYIM